MLLTVLAMSAVSTAACLVTLSRVIGWPRILKNATLIDVGFTIFLAVFLAGTLTGALTAILGGLIMALVLTALRRLAAFSGSLRDRSEAPKPFYVPAGADPSEYNEHGWIYNQDPYV